MRELNDFTLVLWNTLKSIGNVFIVRKMASSYRAESAVGHSFPDLAQHFHNVQTMKLENYWKKTDFKDYFQIIYHQFVKKFTANALNELKCCQKNYKTDMPQF